MKGVLALCKTPGRRTTGQNREGKNKENRAENRECGADETSFNQKFSKFLRILSFSSFWKLKNDLLQKFLR